MKNRTLKDGCKDLLNNYNQLLQENKDLKYDNDDLSNENEDLKQELVDVDADDFHNSEDLERLTKLNKILEKEIIQQKVEIIKLRKINRPNYKC